MPGVALASTPRRDVLSLPRQVIHRFSTCSLVMRLAPASFLSQPRSSVESWWVRYVVSRVRGEMRSIGVAPGDRALVSGFEYRTLRCLDCGDTEQRLVFGREGISATPNLSAQRPTPSEQRLVSGNEDIRAAQNLSAQAPASSVLPAGSIKHEPAAISNAWAQALGKVQQRSTAIAQETARERAAEMGKRATKAPIARSEGLRKSVGAHTPPPRIPLSSKAAVANSLEDFDRLWDSLAACAAPRCANMPSPQEATQPNALTQTSQPDLVLSVPTSSERSQEHQDQTPKVPAILRDSSAPCVPSEPHGRGEPEARRTVWGRAMAMLLRTRVRASVKDAQSCKSMPKP